MKAVQLRKKGREIQLVSAGIANLTPDSIVEGAIMDTVAVSSAISGLLAERQISLRNVAVSVSGGAVMVKRITVAAASEGQVAEAIPAEVQRQLSSDPSELDYDYVVLGPDVAPNSHSVMLVAARREKVSGYTGVLSQAGAFPQVIDIDAFAVQNAFEVAYHPPSDGTFALLNVGASLMNVNIVRDGIPLFARDIAFGGKRYTEALQKALDLSYEEAEKLKLGEGSAQVNVEAKEAALGSVSDSLIAEIKGTFSFFAQLNGVTAIDRVYLSGGTARMPGLTERLEKALALPVEILDPLRGMSLKDQGLDAERWAAMAPRLAVAVGLALRSFD